MIHINFSTIFCTHVGQSPTNATYKYYLKQQQQKLSAKNLNHLCTPAHMRSENQILILVGQKHCEKRTVFS